MYRSLKFSLPVFQIFRYNNSAKNLYTLQERKKVIFLIFFSNCDDTVYYGDLKDDVYRRKPATMSALKQDIENTCAATTLDILANVAYALVRRS